LPTKSHPAEVNWWIKCRKLASIHPHVVNTEEFGTNFKKWCALMQRTWRKGESLLRNPPAKANWDTLKCGGSNGLALVVMALAWWVRVLNPGQKHCARLLAVVEDLTWVLSQLLAVMLKGDANVSKLKRPGSEDKENEPPTKKYAPPLLIVMFHH
jgi:hypothetical protein